MFDEKKMKATFDQVHASDALLTEVLEMMPNNTNQHIHKPHRIARTLLIAAVLICVLAGTVTAAVSGAVRVNGDIAGIMDSWFGSSGDYASGSAIVKYDEWGKLSMNIPAWSRESLDMDVAERLVASYLYTLEGNTVTKGGFTYTIHAILYDSNTGAVMVCWSVENPNGLGEYGLSPNGEVFLLEGSAMRWVVGGRNYLDTVNSTDTKLYISSFGVASDDELWARFGVCNDPENGKYAKEVDEQKIILPRSDRGGMKALTFNDNITVSPVAIRFDALEESADLEELIIAYTDGSEYVVFSDSTFVDNTTYGVDSSQGYVTYSFNRIVDVDNVSAIVVNGEVYAVN